MVSPAQPQSRFHALLIGIDDYRTHPLGGCVNDIDAVQRVLLGPRMALSPDRITRLVAPLASDRHDTTVPDRPATFESIHAALTMLGSREVQQGDRVFIYYSGHGGRLEVDGGGGRRFHRESLVPKDFADDPATPRLLYDYEINELLRAIAARTRSVTVILDCCHAAGATRDGSATDERSRYIDLQAVLRLSGPIPDPASAYRMSGSRAVEIDAAFARGVDDCQVIAACLNHELAKERVESGVRHGLLTSALIAALDQTSESDLRAITWARIWNSMSATMLQRNPWQHPWMAGNAARAVFAGPPVDGDAGFAVSRDGASYRIEAGTLADLTTGAELAVYGERPAYFPRLGSPEDMQARIGVLRVTSVDRDRATANAATEFPLPPGARARLVRLGTSPRLRYAIVPANADIDSALAASPLLERGTPSAPADVRLEQSAGQWFVTDSVQGRADEGLSLFALQPSELDCVRAVLEHYHAYSRPLRMASAADDLPGGLVLQVLSCPPDRELTAAEAQAANLPEAQSRTTGSYDLRAGARVCFRVYNASQRLLRVTLVNSAASGRVQVLGDQEIDPKTHYVFWANSVIGSPFAMVPPSGIMRCADRMVAIGRTALELDLSYLRVDRSFADVIRRTRDAEVSKDIDAGKPRTLSYWTSAQTVIVTSR